MVGFLSCIIIHELHFRCCKIRTFCIPSIQIDHNICLCSKIVSNKLLLASCSCQKVSTHILILAEVSDQNFADEDIKEEKTIASCNTKRMKTLILQASSNDQVMCATHIMPNIMHLSGIISFCCSLLLF